MEEVVEEFNIATQEQFSERICERSVDVSRVDEQERVQQWTVEPAIDVRLARVLQESVGVVRLVPQERVQRRTTEYVVDVPAPQDGDAGVSGETDRMFAWPEVVDADGVGETGRMGAWSEVGIKFCNTDSALEAHAKSCDAGTDSALKEHMEDIVGVPMSESPTVASNDTVVDIPVPMVQTALKSVEAPRFQFIDVVTRASSTVEMVRLAPQQQSSEWIFGQTVDLSSPQVVKQTEHTVEVPVPQILDDIAEVVSLVPQEHVQRQTDERFVDIPVPQMLEDIVEASSTCTRAPTDRRALFLKFWKRSSRWQCMFLLGEEEK